MLETRRRGTVRDMSEGEMLETRRRGTVRDTSEGHC